MLGMYEIVFLATGVPMLMAVYNVVRAFCEKASKVSQRDWLILATYYIGSSVLHFVADIPLINLVMTLTLFISLGLSGGLSIKRALFATIYTIAILGVAETVVALGTGYVTTSLIATVDYQSVFGRIASAVITYAISVGILKYRHLKKDVQIPISYWLLLIIFPLLSLFLLFVIVMFSTLNQYLVVTSSVIVLGMNVLLFSLYDRLMMLYEQRIHELAVRNLNTSYKRQLELMKAAVISTKSFQHDMNKHISMLSELIKAEKFEDSTAYLDQIKSQITVSEMVTNTGNLIVDSIINFEYSISEMPREGIEINVLNVPSTINIHDFDLTVIVSNLVSNAFKAAALVDGGQVAITIDYRKGVLYIKVINDFTGNLNYKNGTYRTTELEGENHGIGLGNVKDVVEKYDGTLVITSKDQKFEVEVIMYSSHN